MKFPSLSPLFAAGVVAAGMLCRADAAPVFATGQSGLRDARAAGAEAAGKAKAALGANPAKVVLVFSARPQTNSQLIDGLSEVFDKSLVYGCEGYSSLTLDGNFADRGHSIPAGVSVMAIGGDVSITPVSAQVGAPSANANAASVYRQNGKAIGAALKEAYATALPGKLILTFGNQHVGNNQPFVTGVQDVLGKDIKMVGAAAGGSEAAEIVGGTIVKGTNIALLMAGHFKVNTAAGTGKQHVNAANETFKEVLNTGAEKASVIFVFDCGGRRADMIKANTLGQELDAMKANAGKTPIFGFYGGGEIGHQTLEGPCQGVGYHVAAAAVIPQ